MTVRVFPAVCLGRGVVMKDHVTRLADLLSPQASGMGGGTAPLRLAIVGIGLIGRRYAGTDFFKVGATIPALLIK